MTIVFDTKDPRNLSARFGRIRVTAIAPRHYIPQNATGTFPHRWDVSGWRVVWGMGNGTNHALTTKEVFRLWDLLKETAFLDAGEAEHFIRHCVDGMRACAWGPEFYEPDWSACLPGPDIEPWDFAPCAEGR